MCIRDRIYNSAEQKAAAGGKRAIFQRAAKTAIVFSRALDTPKGPGLWLRLQYQVADTLVLHKLRAVLGGAAKFAISGGAQLVQHQRVRDLVLQPQPQT